MKILGLYLFTKKGFRDEQRKARSEGQGDCVPTIAKLTAENHQLRMGIRAVKRCEYKRVRRAAKEST